jgi:hypothetical protein
MAMYESEHTKFMREWLANNPLEVAQQKAGRGLWWDKAPISAQERESANLARVPNKPYYYDAN